MPLPLVFDDPYLAPHEPALLRRLARFNQRLAQMGGDLRGPASAWHLHFGLHRGEKDGVPGLWLREWLPEAERVFLVGDFNDWRTRSHPLQRSATGGGQWELFMPDGQAQVKHGERHKLRIISKAGLQDRVPSSCHRIAQEPDGVAFSPVHWDPPTPYVWKNPTPQTAAPALENPRAGLRIYEAHVGMALKEGRVGSFNEFREQMLPRIVKDGYNTLQLMAVQEHPYYASFGYQVSPFFAVSSRFGTPEDLKALVDAAHGMGLRIIMDLVHSHAVANELEGLARMDGTEYQWFHDGPRGHHPAWGSRCFNYGKPEVTGFLLSNVRYWLEEFRFDGFRYDGITSMLYLDHGLGKDFASYDDYFGPNVDEDAVLYLQLATTLAAQLRPNAIQLAEDMSGMPGIARPVSEGGMGFSGRLAMGTPDYWMTLMKKSEQGLPDADWSLGGMWGTLMNRRHSETHVGYVESHDQALVGDKTLSMWLLGKSIYTSMSCLTPDLAADRGVALHKLIRLVTFALCGGGWLNFMGNEFGHPEWVDFPREGNGWSFAHCRRQWRLGDDPLLRFHGLGVFDQALMNLDATCGVLGDPLIEQLLLDEERKILVFRRGPRVFALNFHPGASYEGLALPVPEACDYRVLLDTDASRYAGHGRTREGTVFPWLKQPLAGREQSVKIYLPSRCGVVLGPA